MRRSVLFALMIVMAATASQAAQRVIRDVPYGAAPLQRFDVYAPPNAHGAPVIVMVHGGGWRRGDKSMSRMVDNKAAHWVPKGYVFISINYRLDVDALEQSRDVARSLDAVQKRAAEWGGDRKKIVLMGHSAGAHLVALVGVTTPAPILGTVVLDSAALDVPTVMQSRHFRFYDDAFGSDPAKWRAASPFHAATKKSAPMLIVCSSRRATSCTQAHAFVNKLTTFGTRASVLEENLSHREINEELGEGSAYTSDVDAFLGTLR